MCEFIWNPIPLLWNPDQWYEIRGFGTYRYVPVCTGMYRYTIVYMVHTGMYWYVPGSSRTKTQMKMLR
jgi:hypothetical protein